MQPQASNADGSDMRGPAVEEATARAAHTEGAIALAPPPRRAALSPLISYIASFAIPFAALIVSFATLGITPFGDLSVMLYDMPVQYANYFGWLIEVMHGDADLLYSNAAGLGGGTFSLFTYYLSSPFNLLAFFFSPDTVPLLFSVLYLFKIPTCALTCLVFLRGRLLAPKAETWAEARRLAAGAPAQAQGALVLIACAYALTSYVIGYATNIMWLDGVYMLPLAALGVWRLIQRKRCCGLFAAAVAAILFNWYTGYMVCLFCVLYFFYELARQSSLKGRRLRTCFRFAITLGLAVGAGIVVLLPTALSLLGGKGESAGLSSLLTDDAISRNPLYVLNLFGIGITPGIITSANRPALVVSALALVGSGFFFANPSISKRGRLCAGALAAFMLASAVFAPLNTVWSGFVAESSYTNRNGFVILFVVCFIAAEGLIKLPMATRPAKSALAGGGAVAILYLLSALAWRLSKGSWMPSLQLVGIEAVLLIAFTGLACCIAYVISQHKRQPKQHVKRPAGTKMLYAATACLIIVFCTEQVRATELQLASCQHSASAYAQDIHEIESFYAPLYEAEDEGEFVRMGNTSVFWGGSKYSGPDNMALVVGLSTFDHYSSTQGWFIQDILAHLGYSKVTPFGTYYMSSNAVADALLGVSYIADDAQPYAASPLEGADTLRGEYRLYRNDLALPLGWGCKGSDDVSWTDDPLANQQAMLSDAAGEAADIWDAATVSDAGEDVSDADSKSGKDRTVTVTANASGPLYVHFPTLIISELYYDGGIACEISVDGTFVQIVGGRGSCNVVYLGEVEKGQTVTLTISPIDPGTYRTRPDGSQATIASQLYQPSADKLVNAQVLVGDALENQLARIDSTGFSLQTYDNGKVSATFNAAQDEKLVLSIPFENGWSATVNGQAVDVEAAYGGLSSINVEAGDNSIELHYMTPGLIPGAAVSIICVTLFGVWRFAVRKRKVTTDK